MKHLVIGHQVHMALVTTEEYKVKGVRYISTAHIMGFWLRGGIAAGITGQHSLN